MIQAPDIFWYKSHTTIIFNKVIHETGKVKKKIDKISGLLDVKYIQRGSENVLANNGVIKTR